MVSVFVSHSKHDVHLRKYFSEIFTNIGLKAKFMEWEKLDDKYAGHEISQIIRAGFFSGHDTSAIFVLLGKNLEQPPAQSAPFTHNWINFEVGAAAGAMKPVWVFEEFNQYIRFPIPFVTDYAQYTLDDVEHLRHYGELFKDRILTVRNTMKPVLDVKCPYENCNAKYRCWATADSFYCPVCRQQITRTKNNNLQ